METKITLLFCVTFSAFFVPLNAIFEDCGSKIGKVESLKVTACDENEDKCVLHKNSNVTFEVKFTPNQDIEQLNAVVHGIIMDVPIPFPLPNGNGCIDSGVTCPLKADTSYTYFTTLPILKSYPPVSVDVVFELQNDAKEDITCTQIPSKIK